ncbi:hypothetical protein [Lysobacter enzymogenes]|uniref:hypothetical protein n=1 Tax=Lysobacter enzymogenes TaxID=69 RepID=UPI001A9794D1|nr:hypothetical protein [Lysobacter enzymogenes]QQP97958.1 hypothetical protein JHW38_08130 [Lysobacter enzymogenes]
MKYVLRIIIAAWLFRLIIAQKDKARSLTTLAGQASEPQAQSEPEPASMLAPEPEPEPEPERKPEAQVGGSFLGIPPEYSFLMMLVLFICSIGVGWIIGHKRTNFLMLSYFSYWFPCAAALVFGIGAAYRPTLGNKGGWIRNTIFGFTDKALFEWSAVLLYFGLLTTIYISDCSWPGSELFVNIPIAIYSLMYLYWSCSRPREAGGDEFRLLGQTVIAVLVCFILLHTWLEISAIGFKCLDYKWRYL